MRRFIATMLRAVTIGIAGGALLLASFGVFGASATAPAGGVILNGVTAPAAHLGMTGDFFLDTRTDVLYGPKTAKGWGRGTSLIGAKGATGPEGPSGPVGATGAAGAPGASGVSGYVVETTKQSFTNHNGPETGVASCPTGDIAIGGGAKGTAVTDAGHIITWDSYPSSSASWTTVVTVHGILGGNAPVTVTYYAVCVKGGT